MIGPLVTPRDQGGLGLGAPHPDGGIALSHAGGTGGFRSFVMCIPQWKRGVAVLSNACIDAVVDLGGHALDPRCGLLWYRKEVAIDPACFSRLVGRYRLRPGWVFDVTSTADRLYIRLAEQPAFRVFSISEWHFFYKNVGAQVTFEPGEDGRAARLILHQNSTDQIAERIDGKPRTLIVHRNGRDEREERLAASEEAVVVLLNDEQTPMAFVVSILESVFGKTHEEATDIMLAIHREGRGVCGVYTPEDADQLVEQVMELAREHGHPLQCVRE
jgi:ATP-dependent Clp protease adapter protein ClpS